ncbi:hypothetical protein QVD17_23915 [Tagetes erecta]|uniref:Uncharacterized protein n=1 Tax=Tagetes erecta TaxID=13708 RepID=A0AAD8NMI1_TARER|nr:hypothetical protein QVD17_23915 [Tagetes erecta]
MPNSWYQSSRWLLKKIQGSSKNNKTCRPLCSISADQPSKPPLLSRRCLSCSWYSIIMAGKGKIKIDKFNGQDFAFLKMQINDYLYQTKPLEEKPEKTSDRSDTYQKLLER